jgi:endonuclease YncB( thermonuclease family)
MECAVDCCIDCYSAVEVFRIWLEVTVEITVRIITFGLRIGPIGIVIVVGTTVGVYYSRYDTGRAEAKSGHTIEIGKIQYRLYGVTALKPGHKLTWESGLTISGFVYCRDALTARIGIRKVRCRVFRNIEDRFDRTIAICSIRSGFGRRREDLGRWMVRNGYAVADVGFMKKNPIDNGRYANILLIEQAFAEKNKLGIHAGKFVSPVRARSFFQEKWIAKGQTGEPPFGSLEELEVAFELEWRRDKLFEVKGTLFGGMDVSDLARAAIDSL